MLSSATRRNQIAAVPEYSITKREMKSGRSRLLCDLLASASHANRRSHSQFQTMISKAQYYEMSNVVASLTENRHPNPFAQS